MSPALVLAFSLAGGGSRAVAEETPTGNWFVTTQAGAFGLHETTGWGGGFHLGTDASRHLAFDIGLTLANLEGFGFRSVDMGLTLRACDECRVTPYLVGNAGLLSVSDWIGPWFGVGVGLAARMGTSNSLSVTGQLGLLLGGYPAPGRVVVAWTHRFEKGR